MNVIGVRRHAFDDVFRTAAVRTCDSDVTRRTPDLLDVRRLPQPPHQRVFAPATSDYKNFHNAFTIVGGPMTVNPGKLKRRGQLKKRARRALLLDVALRGLQSVSSCLR